MAHGTIRVNTLKYDTGSGDVNVNVSDIATGTVPTNSDIDSRADARIAADLASGSPTIQAADPDTAKTDVAQTFTKAQRGAVVTLTSASNITIDFTLGNNFILTTGHAAIAFDNPSTEVAGQSGSIFIVQGSTTCAAPTWGTQYLFAGGTAPSLTGTTGKIARIDYIVQEAGKIHCVVTDNLVATS
jgi:hypothetical protein